MIVFCVSEGMWHVRCPAIRINRLLGVIMRRPTRRMSNLCVNRSAEIVRFLLGKFEVHICLTRQLYFPLVELIAMKMT